MASWHLPFTIELEKSNNTKFHVDCFNCRRPFSAPQTLMCIISVPSPNFMGKTRRFLLQDLFLIQKYSTVLYIFFNLQRNWLFWVQRSFESALKLQICYCSCRRILTPWNPEVFLGCWIRNSLWTFTICRFKCFSVSREGVSPATGHTWDGLSFWVPGCPGCRNMSMLLVFQRTITFPIWMLCFG